MLNFEEVKLYKLLFNNRDDDKDNYDLHLNPFWKDRCQKNENQGYLDFEKNVLKIFQEDLGLVQNGDDKVEKSMMIMKSMTLQTAIKIYNLLFRN